MRGMRTRTPLIIRRAEGRHARVAGGVMPRDDIGAPAIEEDTPAAIEFLQKFDDKGPWCLTAIVPDGTTETGTFRPGDERRLERWIERHQGERNVYFTVNVVDGEPEKKPCKADIAYMSALHVDVDVSGPDAGAERAEILRRLRAFETAPSIIIDSGGGFQAFWLLRKFHKVTPENVERLEMYNRGLSKALGGDHCHNIDRLMRLPGTVNLPNAKKRKAGRCLCWRRLSRHTGTGICVGKFHAG